MSSHRGPGSLRVATEKFDDWLRVVLTSDMAELSRKHRSEFIEPVRRVSRQLSQSLQDFRNRLSERMLETLGVPLRTTEMELRTEDPKVARCARGQGSSTAIGSFCLG